MQPNDAFLLFFKGLARHAPGSDESTLRALAECNLPPDPVVYDFGAGTGSSTLLLAEHLQSKVVAVDQLARSLEELRTRAERRGIDEWIETIEADFNSLDLEPGSVDLIWSEGAIYMVGWEDALHDWRPHLSEGGYLVVTDAAWVSETRPATAVEFWSHEYPEMRTVPELVKEARASGFEVVDAFQLPREAWADYYGPLAQRAALVLGSDPADDMREIAEAVQEEIRVWEEYGHAVNYVFFVMRRT